MVVKVKFVSVIIQEAYRKYVISGMEMQNNCVFIISYLMFWFNCYLHSVHSKKQLVSNICLTRDFQLTYDFNTAKLVYGECREHSTWQNRQMPKRPYPQHFSQMDIVVKVQWTASRETQNSVV